MGHPGCVWAAAKSFLCRLIESLCPIFKTKNLKTYIFLSQRDEQQCAC